MIQKINMKLISSKCVTIILFPLKQLKHMMMMKQLNFYWYTNQNIFQNLFKTQKINYRKEIIDILTAFVRYFLT
jgi:hypothetical protein